MGGNSGGSQVQSNEPWAAQKPYLEYGMQQAKDQYQNTDFYPFQTYANFNPLQTQAQGMMQDYATGGLSNYANSVMGANQNIASGGMMDVNSNPYLADYAQAAAAPITQNLLEQTLPLVRNSAIGAGQYGGSRQDLAEGLSIGRAADAIGNLTSNIYSNAYGQNLNAMQNAQAMAPQMAQLGLMPSNILSGVGAQQQAMQQQGINQQMAQHDYPQQQLAQYANLISGNYGGTQATPYQTNPLMSAAGGGMLGYGIGSMAGAAPMWPYILSGAALGYLS